MTASLIGDGIFLRGARVAGLRDLEHPQRAVDVGVAMTVPHVVFLLVGGVV